MTTPAGSRLLAPLTCPRCRAEHPAPLRIDVTTAGRASKQPAPPQLVRVCPACGGLMIVTLRPAAAEALAS